MSIASSFKKYQSKIRYIGMLLIVQKSITSGICHAIHRYRKGNKKHIKDYDKTKESSYLRFYHHISQTLLVDDFNWFGNNSNLIHIS